MAHVMRVKFDDAKARQMIAKIERAGGNMRPVFKRIGVWMFKSVDKTFRVRGRPTKWRKLGPLTIALRKWNAAGGGPSPHYAFTDKILEVTGGLRHNWEYRIRADRMEFGSSSKQADTHQEGGKATFKGRWKQAHTFDVPRRVLVSIHGDDLAAARKIAQGYLNEITRR